MNASFEIPNKLQHGWDNGGNIQSIVDIFPTYIEEILLHEEYEDVDENLDKWKWWRE